MRTTIHRRAVAMLVLCLLAACAPAAHEGGSAAGLSEHVGLVNVTNDGRQDLTLYMLRDGARYRLGRVSRMETVRFSIPDAAVGTQPSYRVQLLAEPTGMGKRPFVTGPIRWRPGQNLDGRVAGAYAAQRFVLVTN